MIFARPATLPDGRGSVKNNGHQQQMTLVRNLKRYKLTSESKEQPHTLTKIFETGGKFNQALFDFFDVSSRACFTATSRILSAITKASTKVCWKQLKNFALHKEILEHKGFAAVNIIQYKGQVITGTAVDTQIYFPKKDQVTLIIESKLSTQKRFKILRQLLETPLQCYLQDIHNLVSDTFRIKQIPFSLGFLLKSSILQQQLSVAVRVKLIEIKHYLNRGLFKYISNIKEDTHKAEKIVKYFLMKGADCKFEHEGFLSAGVVSLFQLAVKSGNVELVELFIKEGVDINDHSYNSSLNSSAAALMTAASLGYEKITKLLVEHGAHVDAQYQNLSDPYSLDDTELSGTALFYAAMNGHDGVVKILIDARADVNIANGYGDTPLHAAVKKNHINVVSKLLECRNIQIDKLNNKNDTVLMVADKNEFKVIYQVLLKAQSAAEDKILSEPRPLGSVTGLAKS